MARTALLPAARGQKACSVIHVIIGNLNTFTYIYVSTCNPFACVCVLTWFREQHDIKPSAGLSNVWGCAGLGVRCLKGKNIE